MKSPNEVAPSARNLLGDRVLLAAATLCSLVAITLGYQAIQTGLALIASAILLALAGGSYFAARGTRFSRFALTFVLVSFVALQIQLASGRLEFHFGVFVALAFLLVYLDWQVILFGAALFAVHHVAFDRLQAAGYAIYCTTAPDFMTILLHAAFVVVQAGVEVGLAVAMARQASEGEELEVLVAQVNKTEQIDLDMSATDVQSAGGATLKATLGRMAGVVATVRQNAASVEAACTEIASGSQDLSNRTEQTASDLQRATETLSSLTAAVQDSADSASQADQRAAHATSVATRAGGVVSEVVVTMRAIEESSRKIADIIAVIDGIAFQTNILALNAAVEAARAGEQGRGFAVVASEVRSLAGRSAEAARAIKALIQSSVERVERGSVLVDQAGTTMSEVVGSIQHVSTMVAAINTSASAQALGIGEVSQAVNRMDQDTQQNAALVEQMAAATDSLTNQAQALLSSVLAFKAPDQVRGLTPSRPTKLPPR